MQLRAVVVCRPPLPSDRLRLGECVTPSSVAAEDELLAICEPEAGLEAAAAAASPDADADACLLRDIGVGKDVHLRLPTYGWQGAPSSELCEREVAPLLQRLLGGESVAIVAYGMTGACAVALRFKLCAIMPLWIGIGKRSLLCCRQRQVAHHGYREVRERAGALGGLRCACPPGSSLRCPPGHPWPC